MNKKGFTLIELLTVIVLLGIVFTIAGVGISKGNENAKIQMYEAKIKNYQKAAVLYAQDGNEGYWEKTTEGLCADVEGICYYYKSKNNEPKISLKDLIDKDYIKCDEGTLGDDTCIITDPRDKSSMNLDNIIFIAYKKYGKIYADSNNDGN